VANISEVYNFTFHRDMYNRPILQGLGKRFRVQLVVRRAMLNEEGGWAEVRLEGPEEEIGRAIADLQTTGVITSGPVTDLVEPDPDAPLAATVGRGT